MKSLIRAKAVELGFSACGFTHCADLGEEQAHYEAWLAAGKQAEMGYLERYPEVRFHPSRLAEGCENVVVLLLNYHRTDYALRKAADYRVAEYALGRDYHEVMREKLHALAAFMQTLGKDVRTRCCVDTAPVLEKALAVRAGLGWRGKNSLLVTPHGSKFFIGEIFTSLPLQEGGADVPDGHIVLDGQVVQDDGRADRQEVRREAWGGSLTDNSAVDGEMAMADGLVDGVMADGCGSCNRCVEACPAHALDGSRGVDARRCLSCQTIERHETTLTDAAADCMGNRIYGCDVCQDVCPYNRQAPETTVADFLRVPDWFSWSNAQWEALDADTFRKHFNDSAMRRAGYEKLHENILRAGKEGKAEGK